MNHLPEQLTLAQLAHRVHAAQARERRHRLAAGLRAQRRSERAAARARRLLNY